jgi:hypothetical protein
MPRLIANPSPRLAQGIRKVGAGESANCGVEQKKRAERIGLQPHTAAMMSDRFYDTGASVVDVATG